MIKKPKERVEFTEKLAWKWVQLQSIKYNQLDKDYIKKQNKRSVNEMKVFLWQLKANTMKERVNELHAEWDDIVTNQIKEALLIKNARNELAKRDFKTFVEIAIENMVQNKFEFPLWDFHYDLIQQLQDIFNWNTQRLRLHMPVRHWKTFITSILFPMFVIWNRPWFKLLLWGATTKVPKQCISAIRMNINSKWYKSVFNNLDIKKENEDKIEFLHKNRLWYIDTIGVGWHLDGVGANILLLDDPYSGRKDAESQTIRDTVENWYKSTWTRRKETTNKTNDWLDDINDIYQPAEILLMTRWQVDDIAWYIEQKETEGAIPFKTIIYQAINEDTGEQLWKEKFSLENYEEFRLEVGEYDFEAIYQQSPIKASWQLFKKEQFKYFLSSELEKWEINMSFSDFTWWMFIDPAQSTNKLSDDTVGVIMWKNKITKDFYVIDIVGGKIAPSEAYNNIFNTINYWKQRWLNTSFISIEQVSINKQQTKFKEDFLDYMKKHDMYYMVYEYIPRENKKDRIKYTLQPRFFNWKIYFLSKNDTGWNDNFKTLESELIKFPWMRHDDFPDALTQWVLMLDSKSNFIENSQKQDDEDDYITYIDPLTWTTINERRW